LDRLNNGEIKMMKNQLLTKFFLIFSYMLFTPCMSQAQTEMVAPKPSILQGSIHLKPAQAVPNDQTGKIQPGRPVKLAITVENKGERISPSGNLSIRYGFAKPLDKEENSVIFKTEQKSLPQILPGQKVDISFETIHETPSLIDFVREDWPLREYQAVAHFSNEEKTIGTLAITFSAYYYPGIRKEIPASIAYEETGKSTETPS
jgi:hypothetical protein